MKTCKYCGAENHDDAVKCSSCGAFEFSHKCKNCGAVYDSNDSCPNCGARNDKKAKVCPQCGKKYLSDSCPTCGFSKEGAKEIVENVRINEKPKKKRKTWLWVLGWLFIFPVPLTILILRNKKMNKIVKTVILVLAWFVYLVFVLAGNSDTSTSSQVSTRTVEITDVNSERKTVTSLIKSLEFVDTKDVTVKVGKTLSNGYVKANVKSKNNFSPEEVIFVSENPQVAIAELESVKLTTYLYYNIKGVGAGETTIYAISADGSVQSEHIKVTVPEPIGVETIEIKNVKNNLVIGETTSPKVEISPYNAEAKTLTWASSDEAVAAVDSSGVVTAIGDGTATITATAPNGVEASFDIHVDGSKKLMNLRVTRQRLDDNNIGDEWSYDVKINGEYKNINIGIAEGEQLAFTAEITEVDDNPDIGRASKQHYVSKEDIENGFTEAMDIYVTENGGRNSGKTAHFVVTFEITPN